MSFMAGCSNQNPIKDQALHIIVISPKSLFILILQHYLPPLSNKIECWRAQYRCPVEWLKFRLCSIVFLKCFSNLHISCKLDVRSKELYRFRSNINRRNTLLVILYSYCIILSHIMSDCIIMRQNKGISAWSVNYKISFYNNSFLATSN